MLKQDLALQFLNQTYHCLKKKKVTGIIWDELGGHIMEDKKDTKSVS